MARYAQTSAPTTEPVTLAEAKSHLRVTGSDEDSYITDLIVKARRYLERVMSRQFVTATWALYLDEFPAVIQLEKLPVASVTGIVYVDGTGANQTLSASLYQTDYASKDAPGRIMPAYGQSWPTTRADTVNAVTVTFTAGYGAAAAVPPCAKHAIVLMVGHWFEEREPTSGNVVNPLPFAVESLICAEDWGSYT